jgi:hypothetical protein
MKLVRIKSVSPLDGFRLRLGLTDGRTIERDVRGLLKGPVFAEIRGDRDVFEGVRVEGGTVGWPNGADLCPDVLILDGRPPWASEEPILDDEASSRRKPRRASAAVRGGASATRIPARSRRGR